MSDAARFLAVHLGPPPKDGQVRVALCRPPQKGEAKGKWREAPHQTLEEAGQRLQDDHDAGCTYVALAWCDRGRGKGQDAVIAKRTISADVDAKSMPGKTEKDRREQVSKLASELPPGFTVVDSGHGLHVHILLPEQLWFESFEDHQDAIDLHHTLGRALRLWLEGLVQGMFGSPVELDHCHGAERVWRVPDGLNAKAGEGAKCLAADRSEWRKVMLLQQGDSAPDTSFLDEFMQEAQAEERRTAKKGERSRRPPDDGTAGEPFTVPRELAADWPYRDEEDRSERDFARACWALRAGKSDECIADLIREARKAVGDPKGERIDYIAKTIASARERADAELDWDNDAEVRRIRMDFGVNLTNQPDLHSQRDGQHWALFDSPTPAGDRVRLTWYLRPSTRFVPELKQWASYRDGVWDLGVAVGNQIHVTARRILSTYARLRRAEAQAECPNGEPPSSAAGPNTTNAERAYAAWSKSFWRAENPGSLPVILGDFGKTVSVKTTIFDDPDRTTGLLAVTNGTLALRTGDLLPWDPELYITKRIDVAFDPAASNERWDAFLHDFTDGDEDLCVWLQVDAFLTALGDGSVEISPWFIGPGGGGRGTYLDAVSGALGEYAYLAAWSLVARGRGSSGHDDELARCRGTRMVVIGESGSNLDEARFKSLTGDRSQSASFKGTTGFTFPRTFRTYIAGQSMIASLDDSGLARRVRVIQTTRSWLPSGEYQKSVRIREADPGLKAYLSGPEARSAILAWIAAGRTRAIDGRHPPCERVDRDTQAHKQRRESTLRHFALSVVEWRGRGSDGGRDAYVCKHDIYSAYQQFCYEEGVFKTAQDGGEKALERNTFFRAINEMVANDVDVATAWVGPEGKGLCESKRGKPRKNAILGVRLSEQGIAWLEDRRERERRAASSDATSG